MKLVELVMRSDRSRSSPKADRGSRMTTEGRRKSPKLMSGAEIDRELADIRAEIERLESLMRQNEELVEVCEPETGKGLDGDDDDWDDEEDEMRSSEDLKSCHEDRAEEIPICHEGNELRSVEDLTDCHGDSQGISNCQLGRETEMRSAEDLKDCREDSQETLHCQLGDERRSGEDLKDCQEGSGSILSCLEGRDEKLRLSESLLDSRESSIQQRVLMKMGSVDLMIYQGSSRGSIPYCQVGRDGQMNLDQPEELTEQMRLSDSLINSEVNMDQQVQLTEDEDQYDILMIGGISIFLPFAPEEAENRMADVARSEEQSAVTVKQKLEQMAKTAQVDEEKNECSEEQLNNFSTEDENNAIGEIAGAEGKSGHSEEWLSIYSRGAETNATWEVAEEEKEAVALRLAAEDAEEQVDGFISPWEMELEMLEDWLNNPEPARELKECELSEKRMTEQQVSQEETAELEIAVKWRLRAIDEDEKDGMGDHDDLPNGQNLLQLGRLQRQSQPQEQLDREIEDIRRLVLRSAQTTSEEKLGREKAAAAVVQRKQQQQNGAEEKLQRLVWDPGGFQQLQGKLMSRSS
jgi:hypothetical protein